MHKKSTKIFMLRFYGFSFLQLSVVRHLAASTYRYYGQGGHAPQPLATSHVKISRVITPRNLIRIVLDKAIAKSSTCSLLAVVISNGKSITGVTVFFKFPFPSAVSLKSKQIHY
jgi:hypothetical protein